MSDAINMLCEVGRENAEEVMEAFHSHSEVAEFLKNEDLRLPIFPTTYNWEEGLLATQYDVDGVVIQLKRLDAIKAHIPFLRLPPPNQDNIKNHFHMLKKHADLKEYFPATQAAYRQIYGICVAQTAGGYFVNLTIMPKWDAPEHKPTFLRGVALNQALQHMGKLRAAFIEQLKSLDKKDMARASIQKNSLSNPSQFNVLAQDQKFVLGLLDKAIRAVDTHPDIRIVRTMSMFGQKSRDSLDLGALVKIDRIREVSVHAACNIVPTAAAGGTKMQLLWSRTGLDDVVGGRGNLFPTLSFSECVNFQSNLDGRAMDVHRDLLEVVCRGEEERGTLTFLQVYTDSPHTHLQLGQKHPVSGLIATCGLLHASTTKKMYGRAKEFMDHMSDLESKMVKPLTCRLEQVRLFKRGEFPAVVRPEALFSEQCLAQLLKQKPMLVPFLDRDDGTSILGVIRKTLQYLNSVLRSCHAESHGRGKFDHAWQTYQAELALEELIYGHPLSPQDHQLSRILGTSATKEKSLTKMRGFLGLSPHNAATSEVCCPPLENWTKDERDQSRIKRMFPLCDSLEAAPSVVGANLLMVLLGDIYGAHGDLIPVARLKAVKCHERVAGAIHTGKFLEMVTSNNAFPFPGTFDRAKLLVTQAGKDPKHCLELGLQEMKLRWFPLLKIWQGKHLHYNWDRRSYVELYDKEHVLQVESRMAVMQSHILQEVERQGLCFSRKMDRYREQGMPWIEKCMLRIPHLTDHKEKLKVLVFLSCIAFIQNGDYVDFKALQTMMKDMPFSQAKLQGLLIQSRYSLPKVGPYLLWKLHEDIPYRVQQPPKTGPLPGGPPAKKPRLDEDQKEEDVQKVEDNEGLENTQRDVTVRFIPASFQPRWSAQELSFVELDPSIDRKQAYQAYLKKCERHNVPARRLRAFTHKRLQLLSK